MYRRRRGDTRPCRIHGCGRQAHDWGDLCPKHQTSLSKHGDPEQRPIRIRDLKTPIDRLKRMAMTPAGATAINAVIDHYRELCDLLQGELEVMLQGKHFRHEKEMRQIITVTGRTKDHEVTVYQMLAMGLLWLEDFDGSFASDEAFRFEVVNVFLKGSSAWQRRTLTKDGKPTAFRQRIHKRTRDYVAAVLIDHLVKHGVAIADRLKRAAEKQEREKARMGDLICLMIPT